MAYETLHWDGGTLLFTTNNAGALDDIKIGGLANFVVSSGTVKVAFNDRDFSGAIAASHTSAGAGTWYPPNPNRQLCSSAGTNDPITQPGPDGITDGINIFQGARIRPGSRELDGPGRLRRQRGSRMSIHRVGYGAEASFARLR